MLEQFRVNLDEAVLVQADDLKTTVAAVFEKMGVKAGDAQLGADVLVLADLSRRTIDGDALESKIEFLESNPVTSQLSAVRAQRYIVVNGADLNPSIRTVDGVEKVADGLSEFGLASPR